MTIALIDGDTPVFASAISSQDKSERIAFARLDVSMARIIEQCGCEEYRIYVSGGENFRKEIDSNYKANRPTDLVVHRAACQQYLVDHWDAIETDGYEADDAVGCEQNENTMIVGIDKDLLMIPGRHYQWPIIMKGKVVKEGAFHTTTYIDGIRLFFIQALVGDKADNILHWFDASTGTWKKNKWALGAKKAEKLLAPCKTEAEMYEIVQAHYLMNRRAQAELNKVLDLLWIWRSYGETYSIRRTIYGDT